MLHPITFDIELADLDKTKELYERLWHKYMIEPGANYNDDWRIVLQKLNDLIEAIEDEHEEYLDCKRYIK